MRVINSATSHRNRNLLKTMILFMLEAFQAAVGKSWNSDSMSRVQRHTKGKARKPISRRNRTKNMIKQCRLKL